MSTADQEPGEPGQSHYYRSHLLELRADLQTSTRDRLVAVVRLIALQGAPMNFPTISDQVALDLRLAEQNSRAYFMRDRSLARFGVIRIDSRHNGSFAKQLLNAVQHDQQWARTPALDLVTDALA